MTDVSNTADLRAFSERLRAIENKLDDLLIQVRLTNGQVRRNDGRLLVLESRLRNYKASDPPNSQLTTWAMAGLLVAGQLLAVLSGWGVAALILARAGLL